MSRGGKLLQSICQRHLPSVQYVSPRRPRASGRYLSMATTITFTCYACNQVLKVGGDKAGKKAKCVKCGTILTIPVSGGDEADVVTPTAGGAAPPPPPAPRPPRPTPPPPARSDFDFDEPRRPPRRDDDDRRRPRDDYDDRRPRRDEYDEPPPRRREEYDEPPPRRGRDDYDDDRGGRGRKW